MRMCFSLIVIQAKSSCGGRNAAASEGMPRERATYRVLQHYQFSKSELGPRSRRGWNIPAQITASIRSCRHVDPSPWSADRTHHARQVEYRYRLLRPDVVSTMRDRA